MNYWYMLWHGWIKEKLYGIEKGRYTCIIPFIILEYADTILTQNRWLVGGITITYRDGRNLGLIVTMIIILIVLMVSWVCVCVYISKLIKPYTINVCSLSHVSFGSAKLQGKKKLFSEIRLSASKSQLLFTVGSKLLKLFMPWFPYL